MDRHPIYLSVTDDLKRSRLTVLFRLILAIPHLAWASLWGIAVICAAIPQWFFLLFAGRPIEGIHRFTARYMRYLTQVYGYLFLLANPFPRFLGKDDYPIDLAVDPPASQARWKTLLRMILVIPAYVFMYVMALVLEIVAFLGWFVCLALGRMPVGMRDLGAYCLRYQQQTFGYVFLLTDRYPTIGSEPPREQVGPPTPAPVA